jgi:hypothetical protein
MKMLVTVYSDAVDEAVLQVFRDLGVIGYTKWKEVLGEGRETGPKLGTHYWPGKNNVLAVVIEDEALAPISKALASLKEAHPKSGIKTFVLQVEETI